MTGVIDNEGNFHNLYFYKIQELCEVMVKAAIESDPLLEEKYNNEYKNKITRFSSEVMFVLHELGWMIYDPFCQGRDEVLFSNGEKTFVAASQFVKKPDFDRTKINDDKLGFNLLTDEYIGYESDLTKLDNISTGIIDSKGFISSSFLASKNDLATLILMFDMLKDENVYEDYKKHGDEFNIVLEYITNKENVISVTKDENESYILEYVSENTENVAEFIDLIKSSGKLSESVPLVINEGKNYLSVA